MPTPQNGQTHSNNSSALADKLFECVWPFCGVGTLRVNCNIRGNMLISKCESLLYSLLNFDIQVVYILTESLKCTFRNKRMWEKQITPDLFYWKNLGRVYCVKSVCIRISSSLYFFSIRTEYRETQSVSQFSVQMRENKDQKNCSIVFYRFWKTYRKTPAKKLSTMSALLGLQLY